MIGQSQMNRRTAHRRRAIPRSPLLKRLPSFPMIPILMAKRKRKKSRPIHWDLNRAMVELDSDSLPNQLTIVRHHREIFMIGKMNTRGTHSFTSMINGMLTIIIN